MNHQLEQLLTQLTFEEKLSLLAGATSFTTQPIPRLGIPEFGMTDGPHGVGWHSGNHTKNTYFPATIGLAATWNPNLAYRYGIALGQETRAVGRHAILAPGLNICRTPLNGRTFEYLFPFGFGLSYALDHLSIDKPEATPNDVINLSVELTNTGPAAGAVVVQVYSHDLEAPLDRPEQALCGFQKLLLQPAETQLVQLPIPLKALRYYHPQLHQWVLDPGALELRVGTASRTLPLKTMLQVE